jgi:hypothetical protein
MMNTKDSELSAEIARVRKEFIWLSSTDVETVARGRIVLKFDDMKGMTKMTTEEMFADWYASLSPEERASYRRRQRLIDDRLADSERRARQGGSTAADVLTASGAEQLSPEERRNYGSGRQKRDSLKKITADFGVTALAKHIVVDGPHGISESDLAECVQLHADAIGQSVAKVWAEDALLQKAAAACRAGDFARQAQHNIVDAQLRSKTSH